MKIDLRSYKLKISVNDNSAIVFCKTYNLDPSKKFVGVEFNQVFSSFGTSGLSIPSTRFANFKEELRVLKKAARAYRGSRDSEKQFITDTLKGAYGQNTVIEVELIKKDKIHDSTFES